MKNEWIGADLNCKILGLPCIEHRSTKAKLIKDKDLILAGKYGFIYNFDKNNYQIIITSSYIANKYLKLKDKAIKGEEVGIKVDTAEALKWTKRLKIPNSRPSQIKYMENL